MGFKEFKPLAIVTAVAGVILALFLVASCNDNDGGGTYYYPHDSSHGYYDTHHHYHYYPKYRSGKTVLVKPNAPSRPRSGFGGGFGKRR